MKNKFICIDSEFKETPKHRDYDVLCFCAYGENVMEKFWVREEKEALRFLKFLKSNMDKYFISHWSFAEIYSMLSLGYQFNQIVDELKIIDTWIEAKMLFNTDSMSNKMPLSLDHLVDYYGIYTYGEYKKDMRTLILTRSEYTDKEKEAILDYCMTDCRVNFELFFKLAVEHKLLYGVPLQPSMCLRRSAYIKGQCRGSFIGMHVDMGTLNNLKKNYYHIIRHFFEQIGEEAQALFDYTGLEPTFKYDRFAAKVEEYTKITRSKWDLTDSGRYSSDGKYLKTRMAGAQWIEDLYIVLKNIRSVRYIKYDLNKMATDRALQLDIDVTEEYLDTLEREYKEYKKTSGNNSIAKIEVAYKKGDPDALEALIKKKMATQLRKKSVESVSEGEENTKKTGLYESITTKGTIHKEQGVCKNLSFRNAPRATTFIPAMSSWLRCLFYVPKGWKMVFMDVVSAEIIAGALISGDQNMLNATAADFYLHTLYLMGLISHEESLLSKDEFEKRYPKLRAMAKTLALGKNYGATKYSLAMSIYGSWEDQYVDECDILSIKYEKAYPDYYDFSRRVRAMKNSPILYCDIGTKTVLNSNSAGNFPIQGAGARALMDFIPKVSNFEIGRKGILYAFSVHDEVCFYMRDGNTFEENLEFVKSMFQESVFNSCLYNKHKLINPKTGEVFKKEDLLVDVDIFNHGDLVYSKDKETAEKILDIIK